MSMAKSLADKGFAEEALAVCDGIAPEMDMSPTFHFLRATILQELNRWDDAAVALRQVLYLEPDFALAHYILGNAAWQGGDMRAAAQHFAALSKVLLTLPVEQVLPDSDGMTVGELRAILPDAHRGGR